MTAQRRLGHQMEDNLAIDGRLEDRAFGFELFAKPGGIR